MSSVGAPQPSPRSISVAACLDYKSNNPHLLVIGGYNTSLRALSDVWCLDVQAQSWKQVRSYHFIVNNTIFFSSEQI